MSCSLCPSPSIAKCQVCGLPACGEHLARLDDQRVCESCLRLELRKELGLADAERRIA